MKEKILILGATGRTGRIALQQALNSGYNVTALVRNPEKLNIESKNLKIVKGSPANIQDLSEAIDGCSAVISFLSALPEKDMITFKKINRPQLLERSIANTIKVMQLIGVERIMILSSIGTGNSYQYLPWFMKQAMKLTNMNIVFDDHDAQEKSVQNSDLDWTIVRSVGLSDNQEIKSIVVDYDRKPDNFKISRKQIAQFFIENIFSEKYINKTVMISER